MQTYYTTMIIIMIFRMYLVRSVWTQKLLPICMWGCGLCSNGQGRHTNRLTIQLAFWQIYDDVILKMFGTN
jgi:hypothetical protein